MALLSGEVETDRSAIKSAMASVMFRMALLSGEVETDRSAIKSAMASVMFRMALLSGEVETITGSHQPGREMRGSGWLCYPGKLKPRIKSSHPEFPDSSGWLCYPGKLKLWPVGCPDV